MSEPLAVEGRVLDLARRLTLRVVLTATAILLFSGLSGVVNATITFDAVVNNTLWIVGHFHHMALLNIGFVVFAGMYAFIPELTGRPLYSDALAKWHIWLTFLLALANSAIWYVEGLEGGPRRFAVLPDRYAAYRTAGVPVSLALGAVQLLFVWNMVQTLRGAGARSLADVGTAGGGRPPRRKRGWTDAAAEALVIVIVLGLLAVAAFVGWIAGHETRNETKTVTVGAASGRTATTATSATTSTAATTATTATTGTTSGGGGSLGGGDPAAGKTVFAGSGCGGCHTLEAAGTSGNVGPNLDEKKPSLSLVVDRVTHGKATMPSFADSLSEQQIKDVAAFVVQSTGGG